MGRPNLDREYLQVASQDICPSSSSSCSSSVNSSGLESILEGSSNWANLEPVLTKAPRGIIAIAIIVIIITIINNTNIIGAGLCRILKHPRHSFRSTNSISNITINPVSACSTIGRVDRDHYYSATRAAPTAHSTMVAIVALYTGGGINADNPTMMGTTEFGEDLFHWNSLELDNGFADSPTTTMENRGIRLLECPLTYYTPLELHSQRKGGPLSAASTPVSARSRSPLQEVSENTVRMRDQSLESSQTSKAQQLGLRIELTDSREYLDVLEMEEDRLPLGSAMSIGVMSNDQDRWKSPTLSALASRSSSRGPSPRPLSPSPTSQRSAMVMAMSGSAAVEDMSVEIPLIETRDEVPLQDIWRMEDEERKDRLNGVEMTTTNGDDYGGTTGGESIEEHIAHMKGEQHAHEEARLIQEAIDAHSRAL
ncbi:hypothetical protein BGZ96_006413 [Linnemannia gamsii]|uniref:Uncharacterized protein n=1 Tax=Linnemannia gamsii TaxID=64522 RepID=A0ABQ7KE94_9FUNG|nr:hypothetical protein BGZ96_006413 [Linnemannia gamsii]